MSLLDALLLDPVRTILWVAERPLGVIGNGSMGDPYNGGVDAATFDKLMNSLPEYTQVNLAPGVYRTAGYFDGMTGGWQPKKGLKIRGAGMDVSVLRLENPSAASQQVYAIGHALDASGTRDYIDISDLSIDCNLAAGVGSLSSAGAVRIMGNHARVSRVKVLGWGTKRAVSPPPTTPAFVIAVLTGDPTSPANVSTIANCGIESCIAVDPAIPSTNTCAGLVVFHVGGRETATNIQESSGYGAYIRNCFIDATFPTTPTRTIDLTKDIRGLSLAWCKSGIVEGNQVHNIRHGGPYQEQTGARELTVRNNVYRNVATAGYWKLGATGSYGISRMLYEGNSIELATGVTGIYGIQIDDNGSSTPFHGTVILRSNRIRYLDGDTGANTGNAIQVSGAKSLQLAENVLDVTPTAPAKAITYYRCGSVRSFENRTSTGALVRTYSGDSAAFIGDLATDADDALLLGLMNKRTR